MATRARKPVRKYLIQKATGQFTPRVQAVGPEHFGVLCFDCAKARSKWMLANYYGTVLLPPQPVEHTRGHLGALLDQIRQARTQHDLRDLVVAIERTGEYHRPVQRACRAAGLDTRLVHPFTSKQFRQPADPGNKTDDTDLAAIFRAAVNGFGLTETPLPDNYERLQLLIRQRRDLVFKASAVCNQVRELLHALMPGYAACFSDLWECAGSLPLARRTGSAERVLQYDAAGLVRLLAEHQVIMRLATTTKVIAWARSAAPAHPQVELLTQMLIHLDDDRLTKNRLISSLERQAAHLIVHTPYVLLLVIPGINVVSIADLAGELGPISLYANPNAITGRGGLAPSRYQSDQVDHANGPLRRRANRRIRAVLTQVADNLITCNHYFQAKAIAWRSQDRDRRWMRVKVAKIFSRLLFAMVAGQQLFKHPCRQQDHYILRKLLGFHQRCDTPMASILADLSAASAQIPRAACAGEAQPLRDQLEALTRRKGPQPLADILPIVLARLGRRSIQSKESEVPGPS